jgi:glycine dehydrogenase
VEPQLQQKVSRFFSKVASNKVWPTVHRIDDVFGDRNFIYSCPDLDNYWGD